MSEIVGSVSPGHGVELQVTNLASSREAESREVPRGLPSLTFPQREPCCQGMRSTHGGWSHGQLKSNAVMESEVRGCGEPVLQVSAWLRGEEGRVTKSYFSFREQEKENITRRTSKKI